MKRYNLRSIMIAAWRIFRKGVESFSVALRMAWSNAKAVRDAKEGAEITEQTHTWAGWRALGYEVMHGSKALFKTVILDPTTQSGERIVCYFGESQVLPIDE